MKNLIYIPIKNFGNIVPWNKRIRAAYEAINELNKRITVLEGGEVETETVAEDTVVVSEVVETPVETPQEDADQPDEPKAEEDTEEPAEETADISDEQIRAKAKDLGIKSWHVKSIENLKAEIAEKEAESGE